MYIVYCYILCRYKKRNIIFARKTMDVRPGLVLRKGKEGSLQRFHPWVFSGAIYRLPPDAQDGDVVEVWSAERQLLGVGHFQSGASIAVRILSFSDIAIDANFWKNAVRNANEYRQLTGLPSPQTNAYRLIHGEGDSLPGLIVDIYHSAAVIQAHSTGMLRASSDIAEALKTVFGQSIDTIYLRCKDTLPTVKHNSGEDRYLLGSRPYVDILENGIAFRVDLVHGQKTGFFLDQRVNRQLLGKYSHGNSVLNCFCYTGGFSLYSLKSGAKEVTSVDISSKAMEQLQVNLELNQANQDHNSLCENVLQYLSQPDLPEFDIVVIDPPAFAKSVQKRHNAVQAYKRLNQLAMMKVRNGGLLFTFSCSQVVGPQLFYDTVVAAGIGTGKKIRVMHQLSQGPDHPIQLYHPEGHYLKGLVLHVEDDNGHPQEVPGQ
jgi:23S rRNA (cytosine1962-C5)-methyltransferase